MLTTSASSCFYGAASALGMVDAIGLAGRGFSRSTPVDSRTLVLLDGALTRDLGVW